MNFRPKPSKQTIVFSGSSASQSSTTKTGLGLSFCNSIVKQLFYFLSGKIVHLESDFSCCSIFTIKYNSKYTISMGRGQRVFEQNKPLIFYIEENNFCPGDTAVILSETQFSSEIGQTIWQVIQVSLNG